MAGLLSSSFTYGFTYDVFLSFRGEDTRMGFSGNLYKSLCERGIRTFIDDEEAQRGEKEKLTPGLVNAVLNSRIAMVIFSKNYASSSFCLEELAMILECFKGNGRVVLPIFYCVEPCDVRNQRGSYQEAFAGHDEKLRNNKEKVHKWRMALRQAADLSGFHFNHGMGLEYNFIRMIVDDVSKRINRAPLYVANYLVGLEDRVLEVTKLLDLGSNNVVHMFGIFGRAGIGKTTVARAVYNFIHGHFENLCFLENVGENSFKYGLVHLQQVLLSKMTGDKNFKFGNVNEGISVIKHRLHGEKVLLVLDDVNSIDELRALAGACDWFGSGSIVIITTQHKSLLTNHKVEITYQVKELNHTEALQLLSWNAFRSTNVEPSYTDILYRAMTCASGLPLALEVIGSNLYGKSIDECKCTLDKYERIPDNNIQNILRVSFDSLDEEEKDVFLDIACCFGGYKLTEVFDILHAYRGSSAKLSIELLIDKSLVKIDDGLVTLHHLIQDMGREIVRKESPMEPGKRSRLWFFEDVVQVLEENTGTDKIEILILDFPKDRANLKGPKGDEVDWDGDSFKDMKNLKTLIIRSGHFSKGPNYLPNSLRVLKWQGYPSPSLPDYFHPKKLAVLELTDSLLTKNKAIQEFEHLTVLDLSYCNFLTCVPDLSGLPKIEKLSLEHCVNLTQIHESVGFLENLTFLDAFGCTKLRAFPPIRLPSLEKLSLSHCHELHSFPEILGKMGNMRELCIMGTPIKKLPISVQNFFRLQKLELESCGMVQLPSSIVMMPELGMMHVSRCEGLLLSNQDKGKEMVSSNTERLVLSYCNISDDHLKIDLTWFVNVKDLNLSGNNFTMLHTWIKEFRFLRNLKLDDCKRLQKIQGIPPKLETLSAKGCKSLKKVDLMVHPAFPEECHSLRELFLDNCMYLGEIRGVLSNLNHFSAKNCTLLTTWCKSMLLNQESVNAGNKLFLMPGTKIPEWFALRTRGRSISFWFRNKFPAISVCLVIGLVDKKPITVKFSPIVLINGMKQSLASQKVYEFRIATKHILLFDLQPLKFEDNANKVVSDNEWNHVEVSCADHITNDTVPINLVTKQIGIHVFKQASSVEDIQFTYPYHKRRKSDDFLSTDELQHQLWLKEKQVEEIGVSDTQFMLNQQYLTLWKPHVEHGRERLSLLAVQAKQDVIWDPKSMEGRHKRAKTNAMRPRRASICLLTQPPLGEAEKDQASQPIPSSERTSEMLTEDEVHPAAIGNDIVNEGGCGSDDVEMAAMSFGKLESDKSSCSSKGSDTDDPFEQVNRKLCVSGKQTISSGVSSGEASLMSIREALDTFELVMAKDLSEVSSDPAMQCRLDHLLDLLSTSKHPMVTAEVKEALVEFKRKAFASFHEFQASAESVKKLTNFEMQLTRIQQESVAGKDKWKDLKSSIKETSLAINTEHSRKTEIEAEIITLKKQLATRERDLEQLVLNVKNLEATRSTYWTNCTSLLEQAQTLLEEADDLIAANCRIKYEGEAAEVKQNRLKSTWSTDLTSQFFKIKKMLDHFQ